MLVENPLFTAGLPIGKPRDRATIAVYLYNTPGDRVSIARRNLSRAA